MADEQLNQVKIQKTNIVHGNKQPIAVDVHRTKHDKNEKISEKEAGVGETNTEAKKDEKRKQTKAPQRTEASVYGRSLKISLKQSKAVGKFIKNKKIEDAIKDLNQVLLKKRAVPMSGEIAHRRGNIMSGKYPINTSNEFIRLLKTLSSNSTMHGLDLDKTIIYEVIPNKAPDQLHRFGSRKFKRTHITIKAKELKK
ncbi:hypothetical protein COX97_01055 [Candidatus Pacearchaeota archaeon CG_4_10_14_0_2_um_filter_05_32_18]|nr:MAG: hypothetical protein COX97_01055 [Candidatus Pacearchaeota archaeon CG_4_10_14_0_2_um_filter_05_32_18]